MIGDKPYNEYITESCLDAIRTIDGDGYGIKPKDLARIRDLKAQYHLDIPTSVLSGKPEEMSSEAKRDAAGYLAICNTFDMDKAYGDDGDYFFRAMEPFDRSALLTLIHYTGTKQWLDEYNASKDNPYNLLNAAKTGNREDIVKSLITNPDGSLIDWPAKTADEELTFRKLAAIKLMYDIDNESFNDKKSLDKTITRWAKNQDVIADIAGCIKGIAEGDLANADKFDYDTEVNWKAGPEEGLETLPEVENPEPDNQQKPGIIANLTKGVKNLFTNTKEDTQNAPRNTDVNM